MSTGKCHDVGKKKSQVPYEQLRLAIKLKDVELCRGLMKEAANNEQGILDYQCEAGVPFSEKSISLKHKRRTYACQGDMDRGYTLFHDAAYAGNVEILQILFEKAPREILRCCRPVHPIHLAITGGHASCVDLIIDEARRGNSMPVPFWKVNY